MRRDVQEIFKMTPHEKQVAMFSATLSKELRPVCKKFMQDVSSKNSNSVEERRPENQKFLKSSFTIKIFVRPSSKRSKSSVMFQNTKIQSSSKKQKFFQNSISKNSGSST